MNNTKKHQNILGNNVLSMQTKAIYWKLKKHSSVLITRANITNMQLLKRNMCQEIYSSQMKRCHKSTTVNRKYDNKHQLINIRLSTIHHCHCHKHPRFKYGRSHANEVLKQRPTQSSWTQSMRFWRSGSSLYWTIIVFSWDLTCSLTCGSQVVRFNNGNDDVESMM